VEQIITIEILGEAFRFKADEGDLSAEEIAQLLTDEVHKVASQFPAHALKTNKLAILVLAALNISKQYVELLNQHSRFLESVSSRANRLGDMIETKPEELNL
jgi:cell division protein ZapA (FtsZ GTPase activity inhibitor)